MTVTPGVELLTRLLEKEPTDFDICVLKDDTDENDASSYPLVVLEDGHLAVHASDLPRLAREFRKAYWADRSLENTACLLLVCPDHATAWADRRRLILKTRNDNEWRKELGFVNLVMTRHSKAPNSWTHRKWLVRRLFETEPSKELIEDEIQHCICLAERFPKNYYAWTHRMFVVDLFSSTQQSKDENALLQTEWQTVEPWLKRHVSDHSAAHYGGHVLQLWCRRVFLSSEAAAMKIAQEALESARHLVELYPTHEVIWIYRRLCGYVVLEVVGRLSDNMLCEQAMSCFVEQELVALSLETARESNASGERRLEWELTQRHGLSYIIWLLEQAKRCHCTRWIPTDTWIKVRNEALMLLTKRECSHNIWQEGKRYSFLAQRPVEFKP